MKKNIISIMSLLLLSFYTGCGQKEESTDLTKRPSEEDVIIGAAGAAETVVPYGSIDALLEETDAVVYGEAKSYRYSVEGGSVSTIEKIEVLDCLYGDIQQGDEISVFKMGGYARLEDYFNSYEEEFRDQVRNSIPFADLSDEEIKNKYILFQPTGDVNTDIGSKSVFFLKESDKEEGIYNRVGSYEGEYVELSDGDFKVPGSETYEEIETAVASDTVDTDGLETCIISWDEIVSQIEQ